MHFITRLPVKKGFDTKSQGNGIENKCAIKMWRHTQHNFCNLFVKTVVFYQGKVFRLICLYNMYKLHILFAKLLMKD